MCVPVSVTEHVHYGNPLLFAQQSSNLKFQEVTSHYLSSIDLHILGCTLVMTSPRVQIGLDALLHNVNTQICAYERRSSANELIYVCPAQSLYSKKSLILSVNSLFKRFT